MLPDRAPPLSGPAEQPALRDRGAGACALRQDDLPYTTGSFLLQYGKTWRTIAKLSLPNKYLRDTADDAPETRSERMFTQLEPGFARTDPATGRRRGLKTAISTVRQSRRDSATKRRALTA